MRDIKFRAWDKETSMFITNEAFNALLDGKRIAGAHQPVIETIQVERVEIVPPNKVGLFSTSDERRWSEEKTRIVEQPVQSIQGNPFTMSRLDVMQYTGLKDKNGVEIYEGDILTAKDISGSGKIRDFGNKVVEWRGGAWGYSNVMYPENNEVIGNIYENPELLKNPREDYGIKQFVGIEDIPQRGIQYMEDKAILIKFEVLIPKEVTKEYILE